MSYPATSHWDNTSWEGLRLWDCTTGQPELTPDNQLAGLALGSSKERILVYFEQLKSDDNSEQERKIAHKGYNTMQSNQTPEPHLKPSDKILKHCTEEDKNERNCPHLATTISTDQFLTLSQGRPEKAKASYTQWEVSSICSNSTSTSDKLWSQTIFIVVSRISPGGTGILLLLLLLFLFVLLLLLLWACYC